MKERYTAEVLVKVPFYDIDPMNVVWHGNYTKYFEKARCALLELFDYGYPEMKLSGYVWPIIDMRLKYVASASFGQTLRCIAELVEYENRLKIAYKIECAESGKRLTKGYTIQVAVDLENSEMQLASPKVLLDKLGVIND